MNTLGKARSIELLRRVADSVPQLMAVHRESQEFRRWLRNTEVVIRNVFGNDSNQDSEFKRILFSPPALFLHTSDQEFKKAYTDGLQSAETVIESMIEEIGEFWDADEDTVANSSISENQPIRSKDVFVVHGRDDGAKERVARFLDKLGCNPIVLHEQPNLGRTIVEKFESHAQASFAVVLLTPDDVGALKTERDKLRDRARQNVIFEFGYFIGRLGRGRVCALARDDVEHPSDYDGVLYIPLDDSESWKFTLVREMKAAGLDVDANLAI